MKSLRIFIPIAVLAFAAVQVFAQTVNTAKLKINGTIGFHSTYAQVVKAFGKPVKETKPMAEECAGGHEKSVKYAGLSLGFIDSISRNGKVLEVMSFDVSSPKFTVSGVKVGDSEAVVKRIFGRRFTVETDAAKGEKKWYYEIGEAEGPGMTTITFKKGRVVNIGSSYTVC